MERYIIYKHNGQKINLFGSTSPVRIIKGEQKKKRLGENTVSLSLESVNPINFSIGDKITVYGEDYFLNLMPTARKTGERCFSYDVIFESIQYDIAKIIFLDEDLSNKSTDSRFFLRGNLKDILNIIINNLNRNSQGLFCLGSYPETDVRDFQYSDNNCLAILQQTCEAYETEFEIKKDGVNYIINIGPTGRILPLSFQYGLGGGAYEIIRQTIDSSNIVTRLFSYGSDKNLPSNYRNFSSRLRLSVNEKSYIEDVEAIKAFGIIEGVKSFDDIYPHREGVVTAINDDILSFSDSGMDFDLNEKDANGSKYLIDGTSAKITFNTGGLAGYTFELVKEDGYNHSTKTFKLVQYKDERGFVYPNPDAAAFQIKVGDKYVITNIYPPQSYIIAAEDKLLIKAKEYLKENSAPRVQYLIKILECFLKKYAGSQTSNIFEIGDYIGVVDKDVNIDRSGDNTIRINSFTRDLIGHTPYAYTIEVSDSLEVDVIERIISEQNKLDSIIKINDLSDVYKNKRNYKTTQELLNMVFDQEGYFIDGNVRPNSVETQMLSVGAKAQQMILRNTVIEANYNGNGNTIRVTGGSLVHYGLFDNPKTWSITTLTTTLTTGDGGLYIYARCPKKEGNAVIQFELEQKKVEDSNFYYFIIGVLHSLEDGVRWISLTYGSSSINGSFIKTGKIISSDGQNYLDLDNNQMRLGDNSSAIEWNRKGDKKLRLKGSIVVSPSGDESPAEVDRGSFDNSKMYYAGDKVSYNGRIFLCIKDTSRGIIPTNMTYWKPYSDEINNLQIGGRNLALNSKGAFTRTNVGILAKITLASSLVIGETYIVTCKINKKQGNLAAIFDMNGTLNLKRQTIQLGVPFVANDVFPWFILYSESYNNAINLEVSEIMVEQGNKSSIWRLATEDIQKSVEEVRSDASKAQSSADQAKTNVSSLNSYVDGAFKDGVIDNAEAKAIEKYLNTIDETMSQVEATYNKVYTNSYLEGSAKNNLMNAKINLFGIRDVLKNSILNAIADGKATALEKADVDSKFATFNARLKDFQNTVEDANKSIQNKLDSLSTDKINNLQIGGRNLILKSSELTQNESSNSYNLLSLNLAEDLQSNTEYVISVAKTEIIRGTPISNFTVLAYNLKTNKGDVQCTFPILRTRESLSFKTGNIQGDGYTLLFYTGIRGSAQNRSMKWTEVKLEKGNKATEWSPAPEDIQKGIEEAKSDASKAQSLADQAKTNVSSLNSYVDGAFKDGVIDNAEAKAIEKYLNTIDETMSQVEATYNKVYTNSYLEGSARTNLMNAKINLFGMRDILKTYIRNAIADGKATALEKIEVDDKFSLFNARLKDFQNTVEDANKSIQNKLDSLSTDKINNLQIGGRNLILKSSELTQNESSNSYNLLSLNLAEDLQSNTEYVISVAKTEIIRGTPISNFTVLAYNLKTNKGDVQCTFPISRTRESLSFKTGNIQGDGYTLLFYTGIRGSAQNRSMKWTEVKLEKGNKATEWSPAPEDIQKGIEEANKAASEAQSKAAALEYVKAALANRTEIDGGLLLTTLLKLGTFYGQSFTEKAGINGVAKNANDVIAWFGGSLQQAIQNLASIVFRMDGSGQIAKGNISWDANGNIISQGDFSSNDSGQRVKIDPHNRAFQVMTGSNSLGGYMAVEKDTNSGIVSMYTNGVDGIGQTYIEGGCIIVGQTRTQPHITIKSMFNQFQVIFNLNVLKKNRSAAIVGELYLDGENLKVRTN